MTDLIACFGLEIDADRFPDPELHLTLEGRDKINDALAHEIGKLGQEPQVVARRKGQRIGCMVRAVIVLVHIEERVAAVHLAVASGLTVSKAALLAARKMTELGALASAQAYISDIESQPDLPLWLRRGLLDIRVKDRLALSPADHGFYIPGEIPATLDEAFARLPAPGVTWVGETIAAAILRLRGLDAPDKAAEAAAFRARLEWGKAAVDYLVFLSFYTSERGGGPARGSAGPENDAIWALRDQLGDRIDLPDLSPLLAAVEAGRSVILTSSHSGLPTLAPHIMRPTGMPLIGVSTYAPTDLDHPREKTLGLRGNFHANFLRAVKILRRDPHLVQLLPDGGVGDMVTKPFLGTELELGQGAAVMAWQGRAAVFFYGSRLEEGRIRLFLRQGPVADKGGDRAAFDAAFYEFYLGCLDEIVMGPPESMAPEAGFWPALAREETRTAREKG